MIDRIELRWINTCKIKARNTDKNWPVQKLSGSLLKFWTGLMDCLWYLFFNWSSPCAQELDILEKKNKPIDERISCIDYINDSLHWKSVIRGGFGCSCISTVRVFVRWRGLVQQSVSNFHFIFWSCKYKTVQPTCFQAEMVDKD